MSYLAYAFTKAPQICLAVIRFDTLLYSAGPRPQKRIFLAFTFLLSATKSSGVNSLLIFLLVFHPLFSRELLFHHLFDPIIHILTLNIHFYPGLPLNKMKDIQEWWSSCWLAFTVSNRWWRVQRDIILGINPYKITYPIY